MDDRPIPFRRFKLALRALIAALIGALCLWGTLAIWHNWNHLPQLPIFDRPQGPRVWALLAIGMGLGAAIACVGGLWNLGWSLWPRPALVLSVDGLETWVFGFLAWEDVERIDWDEWDHRVLGPAFTVVVPNENRVERRLSAWQRWVLNWKRRQGLAALLVPLRDVAIDVDELKRVISTFCPAELCERLTGLQP